MNNYYSNGKLMLIGEYFVLKGATSLSIPTRFGQSLQVYNINSNQISWKSYDADNTVWYNDTFSVKDITENQTTSSNPVRNTLITILHQAHKLNPKTLNKGAVVETQLTFPKHWGLGSSSTLINNIAQWFEINPFELLNLTIGGSGYDIANAQHQTPILYTKPNAVETTFNHYFNQNIYFVYLNKKKNSQEAIHTFKNKKIDDKIIQQVSAYAIQLTKDISYSEFKNIISEYEKLLGQILNQPTVQESMFADFQGGVIKSLGAWGGDFIMVVSDENPQAYFQNKGFSTLFTYDEMTIPQ